MVKLKKMGRLASWKGSASKLISFPDHFLSNSFRFLVLYTVYTSGLAVMYLSKPL